MHSRTYWTSTGNDPCLSGPTHTIHITEKTPDSTHAIYFS